MTQIGEDGDIEMDPVHPRLHQRVARHLHGHGVTTSVGPLPVTYSGQHALDFGRFRRGARPREGPHDVGGPTAGFEQVPEELGDRGLAIRAGDPDHEQVARRVPVERGSQLGHDRTRRARGDTGLHHGPVEQLGDEVLAQEPDRAPVDGLGGVVVAVRDQSGHAAEQVSGHHPSAVMGNAPDLHRCGVPG